MPTTRKPPPIRATLNTLAPDSILPAGDRGTITIGRWVIDQVRRGVHPFHAAAATGILASELQAWTREGALVVNRMEAGASWEHDFTPEQQDQALFAVELNQALGLSLTRTTLAVESHIAGGQPVVKTIEVRDASGNVTEKRTTTTHRAPSLDAAMWKLERLAADVFGSKATVNLTVNDLTDTDGVKSTLEARMEEVAARLGAIDTTASDAAPEIETGEQHGHDPHDPA